MSGLRVVLPYLNAKPRKILGVGDGESWGQSSAQTYHRQQAEGRGEPNLTYGQTQDGPFSLGRCTLLEGQVQEEARSGIWGIWGRRKTQTPSSRGWRAEDRGGTKNTVFQDSGWSFLPGCVHSMRGAGPGR